MAALLAQRMAEELAGPHTPHAVRAAMAHGLQAVFLCAALAALLAGLASRWLVAAPQAGKAQ